MAKAGHDREGRNIICPVVPERTHTRTNGGNEYMYFGGHRELPIGNMPTLRVQAPHDERRVGAAETKRV